MELTAGAVGDRSSAGVAYDLLRHLADGGMAELYLARSRDGGPDSPVVVLKRIRPEFARNQRFVAMFLDEARLASRLVHPGIARVIDVGRSGDTYFYTMEYVHGVDVRELLVEAARRRRVIPPAVAVAIVVGAAQGLHAAHEQRDGRGRPLQVVHRDVSPSNVMVGFDGTVKVVDFGVAKAADRVTETRSGAIKGKIAYLSPEQCEGKPLDRRSDVFSLGITAWELLTQERLFRRDSDYATMHAIISEQVAAPSTRTPRVDEALDRPVLRALASDVALRYATTERFAADLAEAATGLGYPLGPEPLAAFIREIFGTPGEPQFNVDDDVAGGAAAPAPDGTSEIDVAAMLVEDGHGAEPTEVARRPARRLAPMVRARAAAMPPPLLLPEPVTASGELAVRRLDEPRPSVLRGQLASSVIVSEALAGAPAGPPPVSGQRAVAGTLTTTAEAWAVAPRMTYQRPVRTFVVGTALGVAVVGLLFAAVRWQGEAPRGGGDVVAGASRNVATGAPADEPPVEPPADGAPVDGAPVDEAPADGVQVDEAQVDGVQVDEAPVTELPVAPVAELPVGPVADPPADTVFALEPLAIQVRTDTPSPAVRLRGSRGAVRPRAARPPVEMETIRLQFKALRTEHDRFLVDHGDMVEADWNAVAVAIQQAIVKRTPTARSIALDKVVALRRRLKVLRDTLE